VFFPLTQGLRPGLYCDAASRLIVVSFRRSCLVPRSVSTEARSLNPSDQLTHLIPRAYDSGLTFGPREPELRAAVWKPDG